VTVQRVMKVGYCERQVTETSILTDCSVLDLVMPSDGQDSMLCCHVEVMIHRFC